MYYLLPIFVAGIFAGYKLAKYRQRQQIIQKLSSDFDARIKAKDKLVFVNFNKKKRK